jgi:hypothetical protein
MGTPLVAQMRCSFTLSQGSGFPGGAWVRWGSFSVYACLGCKTESKIESTSKVSGSPIISGRSLV